MTSTQYAFSVNNKNEVVKIPIETNVSYRSSYLETKKAQFQDVNNTYQQQTGKPLSEISTASPNYNDKQASAFLMKVNTKMGVRPLENVFQASKDFEKSGPQSQILDNPNLTPYQAKQIVKPFSAKGPNHENVKDFKCFGVTFPNEPKTLFYNFIYSRAMLQDQNKNTLTNVLKKDAFSDMNYRPLNPVTQRGSINCQAQTCAVLSALNKRGQLQHALKNPNNFKHDVYDSGLLKDDRIQSLSEFTKQNSAQQTTPNQQPVQQANNTKQTNYNQQPVQQANNTKQTNYNQQSVQQANNTKQTNYNQQPAQQTNTIKQPAQNNDNNFQPGSDKDKLIVALQKISTLSNLDIVKAARQHENEPLSNDYNTVKKLGLADKVDPEQFKYAQGETDKDFQVAKQQHIHVISVLNPQYSKNLKQIATGDYPATLYVKGSPEVLNLPSMAAVGTRKPSYAGAQMTKNYVNTLVKHGYVTSAGLALGTDTNVHRDTIAAGGRTVAWMPHGLDKTPYPNNHATKGQVYHQSYKRGSKSYNFDVTGDGLADEIVKSGGALVSTYPLRESDETVDKKLIERLTKRDQYQSGMSDGTIAMESNTGGGTTHAMDSTIAQNRLLATPDWQKLDYNSMVNNKNTFDMDNQIANAGKDKSLWRRLGKTNLKPNPDTSHMSVEQKDDYLNQIQATRQYVKSGLAQPLTYEDSLLNFMKQCQNNKLRRQNQQQNEVDKTPSFTPVTGLNQTRIQVIDPQLIHSHLLHPNKQTNSVNEKSNPQRVGYKYVTGDLFKKNADILVNPVNLHGVMGAGLAKTFKQKDPQMFQRYQQQCNDGSLRQNHYQLTKFENRQVLNLPTKDDWKNPSQLKLIDEGLKSFVKDNFNKPVKSVAIPKVGAGLGHLDFEKDVVPILEKNLGGNFAKKANVEVVVGNDQKLADRLNQQYNKRNAKTKQQTAGPDLSF